MNAYTVDLAGFGRGNSELQIICLETLAALGNIAQMRKDKSADSIVILIFGQFDAEFGIQFVDMYRASTSIVVIIDMNNIRLRQIFIFIGDLADKLFENILNSHDAGRAAVFIEHHRDMQLLILKLMEQNAKRLGLRHKIRRTQLVS